MTMLTGYAIYIADFGTFLLEGCVLTLIVSLPFLLVVILRRRRQRRAEQRRIREIIDAKEHPHVNFDRSKPAKAKVKHVEAHTMSLGLCKLVRTGVPPTSPESSNVHRRENVQNTLLRSCGEM